MAQLEQNVDVLRATANNTLSLFSEDIVETFLRDIDEEALAELGETGELSEQATVFKQADKGDNYNISNWSHGLECNLGLITLVSNIVGTSNCTRLRLMQLQSLQHAYSCD